jgi:hypothetical protein
MKMTTYDHTELRKQYEAEAAVNPQAYLNWQMPSIDSCQRDNDLDWRSLHDEPHFNIHYPYRRNPSKPPFVAPTAKEQAMERVGEVSTGDVSKSSQPTKLERHKHADLLIAIAEGETNWQCQQYDLESGSAVIGSWLDCSVVQAGNMLLTGEGENVRIKHKTRIVQYRLWVDSANAALLWTSESAVSAETVQSSSYFVAWLGDVSTVEVPV